LSTFKSPILRRLSLVFEKIDNVDKVRGKMKKQWIISNIW